MGPLSFRLGLVVTWLTMAACGGGGRDAGVEDEGVLEQDTGARPDGGVDAGEPDAGPGPPPQVTAVEAPIWVEAGGEVQVTCAVLAEGPLDDLVFAWAANGQPLAGDGAVLDWTAPDTEGNVRLSCTVEDPFGQQSTGSAIVSVLVEFSQLVARWPFDGDVVDASGNGLDGSGLGGATPAMDRSGRRGAALRFDGDGAVVTVPDDPSLSLTGEVTIALWIRREASTEGDATLVRKADGLLFGNFTLELNSSTDSRFPNTARYLQDVESGNYSALLSSDEIVEDRWFHVAFTLDADRNYIGYLDGAREISAADVPAAVPNMSPVTIGNGQVGFPGVIDEVRIYDVALTDDQIIAIAESPY